MHSDKAETGLQSTMASPADVVRVLNSACSTGSSDLPICDTLEASSPEALQLQFSSQNRYLLSQINVESLLHRMQHACAPLDPSGDSSSCRAWHLGREQMEPVHSEWQQCLGNIQHAAAGKLCLPHVGFLHVGL